MSQNASIPFTLQKCNMKIFNYSLLLLSISILHLSSCGQEEDTGVWLIPETDVFDGGPGKDGIPSVDVPDFSPVNDIQFLEDEDLVIAVKVNDEIKAYPHPILDWHEIVNDRVDGKPLAITYCPLTGTGIGWERDLGDGEVSAFGVSGLLYNTNLIPYDRRSDSNWSQMQLRSVNGQRAGQRIVTHPVVETSWQTFKALYPDALVMNTNTNFNRNYQEYPYGDYRTNDDLILFPIDHPDDRLAAKDRGLGILINESSKFYPLTLFASARAIVDQFVGQDLLVIGSQSDNYIVAFEQQLPDGTTITPAAIAPSTTTAVMVDTEGNEWNLFGEAISGPRTGAQLTSVESYIGFWFAWATFYPNLEIAN